jgi:kumamolisin
MIASRRAARRYALALLVPLLAACASSATRVPTRTAAPSPPAMARAASARNGPTVRVGPTDPTHVLSFSLVLSSRAPGGLDRALAEIEDPRSPRYHHYLTPAQIAAQYGPDPAATAKVESALRAAGLSVTGNAPDGLLLSASGPAARIEALFSTQLDDYRDAAGQRFYAPRSAPRLPSAFGAAVTGVLGLDTRQVVHTGALLAPAGIPQTSGVNGLGPSELQQAYNVGPLRQAGLDGSGQTIALPEIDTFRLSDVQSYDQTYGITAPPVEVIPVNGGTNSLSPEPVLDIEVVHALAPHAHILVYESQKDLSSVARMFDRIVSDNRARVVSISLGSCEGTLSRSDAQTLSSTFTDIFTRAASQGMSVLVASGDSGAYDCQDANLSVGILTANPHVTAVGGTALFLSASGAYGREAGWEGPLEGAGGGGGVSVVYPRPDWQTGSGVNNQYSNGNRQVPDVSADADPLTGYSIYYSGDDGCSGQHCFRIVGGTSAAAPLWASLILLANQKAQARGQGTLGFLNPALYRIGNGPGAAQVYHDVALGGNLYYAAAPTWDYSTGWGSPDADALVPALLANR